MEEKNRRKNWYQDKYVYCCASYSYLAILSGEWVEIMPPGRKIEGISFKGLPLLNKGEIWNNQTVEDWDFIQSYARGRDCNKALVIRGCIFIMLSLSGRCCNKKRSKLALCEVNLIVPLPFGLDHFEMKYWIGISLHSWKLSQFVSLESIFLL